MKEGGAGAVDSLAGGGRARSACYRLYSLLSCPMSDPKPNPLADPEVVKGRADWDDYGVEEWAA